MNIYDKIKADITQPYYKDQFPNDGQRFVAWYLRNIYGLNTVQAKDCITDGQGDKQIDAVYVDDQAQTAYIIQGKFYSGPTIDAAPLREVLSSWILIKDLPRLQDSANDKLQSKITELAKAIEEDYHICFELLTTSSLTSSAQDDLIAFNRQLTEDEKLSASIVLVDADLLQSRLDEALDHARPYINYEFPVESDKILQMKLGDTKVAKENAVIAADQEKYSERYNSLAGEYEALQRKREAVEKEKRARAEKREALETFYGELEELEVEFSPQRWNAIVEKVVVGTDGRMKFFFVNGRAVTV